MEEDERLEVGARLAIVADDLTGALDCAAPFAALGTDTYVALSVGFPLPGNGSVVSVNADSRRLDRDAAASAVLDALDLAQQSGNTVRYVKIDSTLRGHPGLEIETTARAARSIRTVVVAPAFPAMGRTVQDGMLLVHGVPLADTDVGRDPLSPAPTSRVVEILRKDGDLPVHELSLEAVHSQDLSIRLNNVCEGPGTHPVLVSCDTESDSDLDRLVSAGLQLEQGIQQSPAVLFAGSAGLAAALARKLAVIGSRTAAPLVKSAPPLLIVTASQRTVASQQIAKIVSAGLADLLPVEFDVTPEGQAELNRFDHDSALSNLSASRNTVLRAVISTDMAALAPDAVRRAADAVTHRLGRLVAGLVDGHRPGGLVIIGGDTAFGVLTATGAHGIFLAAEPLPGVPVGTLSGGKLDGVTVATKAGAFGDENTLLRLLQNLLPDN